MGTIDYLKRLFLDRERPLERRDFGVILGLLWFMNAFQARGVVLAFGSTAIMARGFGSSQIAAHSLLGSVVGTMFFAGIPWSAALIAGSVLAVRRAFRTNLAIAILGGIPVFALMRSFVALPAIASTISEGMAFASETNAMVRQAGLVMAVVVAGLALIGLGVVVAALAVLRSAGTPLDSPEASKPGRCKFLIYSAVIGIVGVAFALLAAAVGLGGVFDGPSATTVMIVSVSATGILSILGFILVVMRMLESGTSLLWLLPPFAAGALGAGLVALSLAVKDIWAMSTGSWVVGLGMDAQAAIFIALVLRPSTGARGPTTATPSMPTLETAAGSPGDAT